MKKKIGELTLKEIAMNVVRCDNRKSVYCNSCVLKNESSCYSLKRQSCAKCKYHYKQVLKGISHWVCTY